MRIAFIRHKLFDARAGDALARAFNQLGHEARGIDFTDRNIFDLAGYDVIIEPCHARDEAIPTNAIHIPWVQEFYGCGDPAYENAFSRDLIYTFGLPEIIGCPRYSQWAGSLTMAVDPSLLERPPVEPTLDFSMAGFIAPPDWFIYPSCVPTELQAGIRFGIQAEAIEIAKQTEIKPLTGSFDQRAAANQFRSRLQEMLDRNHWSVADEGAYEVIWTYGSKLAHEYARLINRTALVEAALGVSKNIEIWGLNWDQWPKFKPYWRGFTNNHETLLGVYERSRINLHDNIFGFAMHSRVLEAMAVGGFVMANESPHRGQPGQITETFEPGVHFSEYSQNTFHECATWWLPDTKLRRDCTERARQVIKDKHLWKHRAQQILGDLK